MTDAGVIIPADVSQILSERVKIWGDFDKSQSRSVELGKLFPKIAKCDLAQIPAALTAEKTPPAELDAALAQLNLELAKIAEAQMGIKTYQDEIQNIETERRILISLAVVIIVGVLLVAAVGIVGMISYLLLNVARFRM